MKVAAPETSGEKNKRDYTRIQDRAGGVGEMNNWPIPNQMWKFFDVYIFLGRRYLKKKKKA